MRQSGTERLCAHVMARWSYSHQMILICFHVYQSVLCFSGSDLPSIARPLCAMTQKPVGLLRWDAPSRNQYSRGSRDAACSIAGDAEAVVSEVASLQEAEFAHSSRGPHASRLKTVELLGTSIGLAYPLTVDMLYKLAAILRGAGYRSAFSYVSRAVQEHRARDHPIGPAMTLALQRIERACLRGAGPPKQGEPFQFERFVELPEGDEPWVPFGYIGPKRAMIVGAWWMNREIELSNLWVQHVQVTFSSDGRLQAALRLPASKRDPQALGEERLHGCICHGSSLHQLCPAHAVQAQVEMLRSRFSHLSRTDFDKLPLFPNASGCVVAKHRAVRTFWFVAKVFGEELWTTSGALRFGGHVLRITMAIYLGKSGVDIWRIQLLGRWGPLRFSAM